MAEELSGLVARGDGRGRALGFPTANVGVPEGAAIPAEGVYAGWVRRADGSAHKAAISIGRRPQFYGEGAPLLVEAFMLDFDEEIYGERVSVAVGALVRAQATFESVDALIVQMEHDVGAVYRHLEGVEPPWSSDAGAPLERSSGRLGG